MKHKKSKKIWKKFLLALLAFILLCIAAAVIYVVSQYSRAYAPIDIVERPDTYVMPDYPELDANPPETTEAPAPETTAPAPETTAPVPETTETAAPQTTEAEPPQTVSPETDPPVTAAPETDPPVTTRPPETVAITIAPPVQTTAQPVGTQAPVSTASAPATTAKTPVKWSVYIRDPIYNVKPIDPNVINILLLGIDIDTRQGIRENGRSDTMIIVSYNKKTGEINMISLLRDALVPIENHDWNRLNTAYAFGGAGKAVNTVNQLFGLDIQHYVAIDWEGVKKIFNYVGGINVNLTQAEANYYNAKYGTSYTAGLQYLDTQGIMHHIRNRSSDSDFERTRRQRDVLIAVAQKLLKEKTLPELLEIVEYTTTVVGTNIDMVTLISLASSVFAQRSQLDIETCNVPFSDAYTSAWYNRMAILSFDIQDAAKRIHERIYAN